MPTPSNSFCAPPLPFPYLRCRLQAPPPITAWPHRLSCQNPRTGPFLLLYLGALTGNGASCASTPGNEQRNLAAIIQTGSNNFPQRPVRETAGRGSAPSRAGALLCPLTAYFWTAGPPPTQPAGGRHCWLSVIRAADCCCSAQPHLPEFRPCCLSCKPSRLWPAAVCAWTSSELFSDQSRILSPSQGLPLPPGSELQVCRRNKRGARTALSLGDSQDSLLSAQTYGAGRSAFLGLSETWKWRFMDHAGETVHQTFWNCLLVWLAEQHQPQLQPGNDGAKVAVDEPVGQPEILGSDFSPAADALASAVITARTAA